jgi:hypothetical protein
MAAAVPVPLTVGVGITEDDGKSVIGFGHSVQHNPAAQAGDADGVAAA